jgi:hypothetical protein
LTLNRKLIICKHNDMKYTTPKTSRPDDFTTRRLHIVEGASSIYESDVTDEFNARCYCSHDCCGHEHTYVTSTRLLSGDRLAVRTYSTINL